MLALYMCDARNLRPSMHLLFFGGCRYGKTAEFYVESSLVGLEVVMSSHHSPFFFEVKLLFLAFSYFSNPCASPSQDKKGKDKVTA